VPGATVDRSIALVPADPTDVSIPTHIPIEVPDAVGRDADATLVSTEETVPAVAHHVPGECSPRRGVRAILVVEATDDELWVPEPGTRPADGAPRLTSPSRLAVVLGDAPPDKRPGA
jgi:hypothetical protein